MEPTIPASVTNSLESIERRFHNERATQVVMYAEGRICFEFQGQKMERWLLRNIPPGVNQVRNILGTVVSTTVGKTPYYNPLTVMTRNSRQGNSLAEAEPGKLTSDGYLLLERTLYTPQPPEDLTDIEVLWEGAEYPPIASLNDFRRNLDEAIRLQRELEEQLAAAAARQDLEEEEYITKEIAAQTEIIRRIRERIATFSTASRLRSRFSLDRQQNLAKRLNLLNEPAIIEGGPGTGKTTTLINRVQYLLDTPALREAEDHLSALNADDDALLSRGNQQPPYRFYSPNVTLRFYLEKALEAENLKVSEQTVTTWPEHRKRLLRDWQLTGTERRFQTRDEKEYIPWLLFDVAGIAQLRIEIDKYAVKAVHDVVLRMQQGMKAGNFAGSDTEDVQLIVLYAEELLAAVTVADLLAPLFRLQQVGAPLLTGHRADYAKARDAAVMPLLGRLRNNPELMAQLAQVASSKLGEEEAGDEIDNETFGEAEAPALTARQTLLLVQGLLNRFVVAYALAKSLPEAVKFSARNKQVADLLRDYLPDAGFPALAGPGRFLQLFNPLLAGPEALLLTRWPAIFAALRSQELYGQRFAAYLNPLPTHPAREYQKTARLHADEADVLLLGICLLNRAFYKDLPNVYANSTNRYAAGFRNEIRPVIAIDEASDYSLLQLTLITQLSHPKYNCVTLSGDLMQRLGSHGLTSWQDYTILFPATKQATLNLSYRQNRPLLRLAARLYELAIGTKPTYKPSGKLKVPFHLKPVVFKSTDEQERFEWLVTVIVELQAALDQHIPNLAVLVKDTSQAKDLADRLNEDDRIQGSMMGAQACEGQSIGQADVIRVFPVTEIKGMEFDGVILWEADLLAKVDKTTQIDRLMYIALSRASFYIAVVLAKNWPKALQPVKKHFTNRRWDEQMLDDVADDEANDISLDDPNV